LNTPKVLNGPKVDNEVGHTVYNSGDDVETVAVDAVVRLHIYVPVGSSWAGNLLVIA
jgi:hypothetical protein